MFNYLIKPHNVLFVVKNSTKIKHISKYINLKINYFSNNVFCASNFYYLKTMLKLRSLFYLKELMYLTFRKCGNKKKDSR